MIRYVAPLVVFAVLVAVFVKGLNPDRNINELPSPFLGKEAPTFDLPDLEDLSQRVTSNDYAGDVALVNFWATWCVGCRQEHPFLMQLSREIDIPIYGIDWRDQRQPALDWLARLGDPYEATGFDADATIASSTAPPPPPQQAAPPRRTPRAYPRAYDQCPSGAKRAHGARCVRPLSPGG